MSIFSNIFNRFKKHDYSEPLEDMEVPKVPTSTTNNSHSNHSKPLLHSPHIYNSPNYHDIRSNISTHQNSLLLQYHDLAYVASLVNDSLVVGAPIKHSHSGKMLEEYNRIFAENSEFASSNFRKNIKLSKKLDAHLYTRAQLFANIREVYPDFGQNMKKKVSVEDYDIYHQAMVDFRKSLSLDFTNEPLEIFSETLSAAQKKVASVVDTFRFSRACEIEDRFIISEINTFFTELAKAPPEAQIRAKKSTIELENGSKINTIDFANRIREERISRLKKYSEMNKLKEQFDGKAVEAPDSHSEH